MADKANETHTDEQARSRSKNYEKARSTFDGLGTEEKAAFLVESIIRTVTDGLREVSEQVADAFKQACEQAEAHARGDGEDGQTGEAPKDAKKEAAPKKKSASKAKKPASEDTAS
ncbi:MAG: hypothetical protein O3C45_02030 [Bacteroidetes bacterium]|nr:hypothetical protein [Bacteroidota bacterium]